MFPQDPMKVLGQNAGATGIGSPQQHSEGFSPVPTDHIAGSHIRAKHSGCMEDHFISCSRAESLAQLLEFCQLEDDEGQWLAVASAEIHRAFQLRHEGGVIEQAGQPVPVYHLTDPAAPGCAGNHGLDQQGRIGADRHEIVGAGPECRDPLRSGVLTHKDDGQEMVASILADHSSQGEGIRVLQTSAQQEQIGGFPVQRFGDGLRGGVAGHSNVRCIESR